MTLERRKAECRAALERDRAQGRHPFSGFAFAFTRAVADSLRSEPNEAEVFLVAVKEPSPPSHCPGCGHPCTFPVRVDGEWTWCCSGGCNP